MARCDYCGTLILLGGLTEDGYRFCSGECHQRGVLLSIADQIPGDMVSQKVAEVHEGACPQCGGPGPVDVHTSYHVWSAIVMTSWHSRPEVCCRACGVKSKLKGALLSGTLGWWGIPWGIVITPIQVIKNVFGLASSPDPTRPSAQLENIIKVHLAEQVVASHEQEPAEE